MSPSSLSLTPTSVEFWYRIIKTSPFHKVIQVFCALIIQIETSSLLLYMRLTYLGLSTMLIPCYKQRINVCWWQCLILLWNISWDIVIGVFNHDIQENIRPHFIFAAFAINVVNKKKHKKNKQNNKKTKIEFKDKKKKKPNKRTTVHSKRLNSCIV